MIRANDLVRVREQFGVADAQVVRDHVISHLLAALSQMPGQGELVFFGGTALSRTLLPDLRLSEDIDLLTTARRSDIAPRMMEAIDDGLARSHGSVDWFPPLHQTRGSGPAVLRVADAATVQIQLLSYINYPRWPTLEVDLEQRYGDAPPARMKVLTPAAFVAAKLAAWRDRRAPRDLYDLWALADAGHVTAESLDLYVRMGPTGQPSTSGDFVDLPSDGAWSAALAHQCRIQVDAPTAARRVSEALRRAGDLGG
ncbi:nucleotidyl transferase AbiEii/AbiGii toxin family protein [Aeromicrobium piscarium]|uniref:Nucleotidyl transferase AbiEii/AbiGii toxin family protein n=1 Tax=Aeromicrobium piscarium TaxID=2590901 RepID=A0A554SB67_9ACTN|nr:nucleotidyl transferase AbiEii/AbiGii toxin family protein [Aeromicrobium piscarium]TSD63585.1 nucleotidyl transferase AbiEii/AbiGii toxin family protein [Aeromicrobium piscarium]